MWIRQPLKYTFQETLSFGSIQKFLKFSLEPGEMAHTCSSSHYLKRRRLNSPRSSGPAWATWQNQVPLPSPQKKRKTTKHIYLGRIQIHTHGHARYDLVLKIHFDHRKTRALSLSFSHQGRLPGLHNCWTFRSLGHRGLRSGTWRWGEGWGTRATPDLSWSVHMVVLLVAVAGREGVLASPTSHSGFVL